LRSGIPGGGEERDLEFLSRCLKQPQKGGPAFQHPRGERERGEGDKKGKKIEKGQEVIAFRMWSADRAILERESRVERREGGAGVQRRGGEERESGHVAPAPSAKKE